MERHALSLILFASMLVACSHGLPSRSSPATVDEGGDARTIGVADPMGAEAAWYNPFLRQVVRASGGNVLPAQPATLDAPVALRLLSDDTIVALYDGTLAVYPRDGAPYTVPVETADVAFDGHDAGSIWYAEWRLSATDAPYVLCHVQPGGAVCPTEVPNVGGYNPAVGVDDDGGVYVTDRDRALYRWDGTTLQTVASPVAADDFVVGFRHGDGAGLLALGYARVYGVDGTSVRTVWDEPATVIAGSPSHFVVGTLGSESTKLDPACHDGLFSTCERRTVWTQYVFTEVTNGSRHELGHEDCDDERPELTPACGYTLESIGLDGEVLIVVGTPLREVF